MFYVLNPRRNVAPQFPRRSRAPSPSRSRCRLRFLEVGGSQCRLRPSTFPSSAYRVGGRPASVLSLFFGMAPHLVGTGSHMIIGPERAKVAPQFPTLLCSPSAMPLPTSLFGGGWEPFSTSSLRFFSLLLSTWRQPCQRPICFLW